MIPRALIPFTRPDAEPSYADFEAYRAWLAKVTGWQCITYLEDGAITVCALAS